MNAFTEADARAWVAQNLDGIMQAFRTCRDVPDWFRQIPKMERVWQSGCWLRQTLLALGATEEEASDICFCHGQRACLGNPWAWAVNYANEFAARGSVHDRPGPELAERIEAEGNE